jgi:hypothetical protein
MRRKASLIVEPLECRSLLSGLSATLTTDQSVYMAGQPIQMTFTYTNTGSGPASIGYGPSVDGFTVSQAGQSVWQSNSGINPDIILSDILQPGQSFSLHATWDGTLRGGTSLTTTTGSFVVTNQLDPSGPSATFQIDSPLSYSSTVSQSVFQFGQPVDFSYTITNTSLQPVTFNLPPTDFTVTSASDGDKFWESDPGASSQPPTPETLQPAQSITETATWNGIANEGTLAGTNVWEEFDLSIPGAPAGSNQEFTIASPLTQAVTTDQTTYQSGESIVFKGTETNASDQAVTILNVNDFFRVMYSQGVNVPAGGSSSGQVVTLQPGQSQTFTATWNPSADGGSTPFPAGTYEVAFVDNFQGEDWASFVIDGSSTSPQPPASPPSSTAPPVGSSSPNSPVLPAPSSSNPPQAPITPSATAQPPVFTATLTTNHATTHRGKPVRITITFKNMAKTTQLLALDAATDGITVLHGSTVIAKIPSTAKTHWLNSGKSLQLMALWNGKPNQAGVTRISPGIYTIEFDEGGYSASGQIRIA